MTQDYQKNWNDRYGGGEYIFGKEPNAYFKEKLFDKTSTLNHPWVIVDAQDKRVSGLNAIRYILQNIPYKGKDEKVLDKSYPEALAVLRPKS